MLLHPSSSKSTGGWPLGATLAVEAAVYADGCGGKLLDNALGSRRGVLPFYRGLIRGKYANRFANSAIGPERLAPKLRAPLVGDKCLRVFTETAPVYSLCDGCHIPIAPR